VRALPETVCLVVPCYNERERLDPARFAAFCPPLQLLFVDDGSTDGTGDFLERALPPGARLLRLAANRGKAEAVRAGMLAACAGDAPAWIGFWDADLATPLDEVAAMLRYQQLYPPRVDAVFGSRIYRLGARIDRSYFRHLVGRAFATAAGVALGVGTYDSQCGAKLFRREVVPLAFAEPFVSRWIFDLEIVLRLGAANVIECPLNRWSDVGGSKIRMAADFWRVARDIARIRARYHADGDAKPREGSS
jgi:glycosyltransferase involved in cell wall biosynthesis